ncbi:ATP-dependent DNA helicase DinG [Metabacillus sp. GX 13764]|uniref:ATP-dependent DNA helicase DinG n=1 Tax=Metabacillus kandeliae TaxID=2900151 RepID=UPI001E63E81C|nr:ATP-dependent DNA helicase DinG [Metabacillus kandeliae]MCD7033396.1 ATP-dependent DNA helicase DinG [Metabacillus kandeliae]
MKSRRYVVLDVETTGNSPKKGDRIIQFAAAVLENGEITEQFASFVNPEKPIPLFIEQLTGITDEMVKHAPLFSEIAPKIAELLEGAYFTAHNVSFDLSFVQAELERSGFGKFTGGLIDTVELSRIAFPAAESYKLSELCNGLGIEHLQPHRADSDAYVTAILLQKIFEVFSSLPALTLKSLLKLSSSYISDAEELFAGMIQEKLKGLTAENRVDIELYRSLAVKRPAEKPADRDPLFDVPEKLELPHGYREREGQSLMMNSILQALESHEHLLLEAGTGTGKTMGYLLPSLIFSLKRKAKVIISTHTTSLQQQLLTRDIPALQSRYPFFKAALLKGQGHYLSLQKFERVLADKDDNYDSILAKSQILVWLTETESGDRDEINLPSGGAALWNRIQCTKNSSRNNPWLSRCFYQRAKQKAEEADLIITNHSLLLADAKAEKKLLPSYQNAIIDEAHHLEKAAGAQLGRKLDYLAVHTALDRIGHLYSGGLMAQAADWMEKYAPESYDSMLELDVMLKDFSEEANDFFQSLHSYVQKKARNKGFNKVVYKFDNENNSFWHSVLELADRLKFYLYDLVQIMEKQRELIGVQEPENVILEEYFDKISFLNGVYEDLAELFFMKSEEHVRWIEIEAKGAKNAVSVYSEPLSVSELLADQFFHGKNSVILTSATMSVEGSFKFIIGRLGLKDFYPSELLIPSPYDYKSQTALLVPADLPSIQETGSEEYAAASAKAIALLVKNTPGKMLVLFTSYDLLRKTYHELKEIEGLEDYIIMGQGTGSGSRTKIAKSFRQFEKAILLGTSSFWEGIDFPGNELTSLVIVRLPFSPPDDPIVSAKCEKLVREGKNAFYEYSLPEAVIRFRQGFGRLIRSENDRGLVYVFDKRLTETKYGVYFLQSIPELQIVQKPLAELAEHSEKWFRDKGISVE